MRSKLLMSAILSILLFSCETGQEKQSKTKKEEAAPQWIEMDVNDGGYALKLFVPTVDIAKGEGQVEYLENSGELHLKAGEEFDVYMYEDDPRMQAVLNEIKHHPFYKVEIIEQTDSTLLYRYYLENLDKETWQFYAERSLGQPVLVVKSNKEGMFTEFYARLMLESALKIEPLK